MDHYQQSAIAKLQNILKPYKPNHIRHKNEKAKNAKLLWNAPAFFGKIVLQSKSNNFLETVEYFEKFVADYNKNNSVKIQLNELFQKHWLRSVLGFVHIPPAVRSVVFDYEKFRGYKYELLLLRQLGEKHSNAKTTLPEYEKALSDFQEHHNIIINEDWLEENKRITNTGGIIKIAPVDYYFMLLDNWEVFAFLYNFRESNDEKTNRYLTIDKTIFENIYGAHKANFKNTPSVEELVDDKTILQANNEYRINIYDSSVSYLIDYESEIAAYVWQELLLDNTIATDSDRLKRLLKIRFYRERWPKLENLITFQAKESFLKTAIELVLTEPDLEGVDEEITKCFLDFELGSNLGFQNESYLELEPLTKATDYYDFHQQMRLRSKESNGNLFYVQESRSLIGYLIYEIVQLDTAYSKIVENDKIVFQHFAYIKKLLSASLDKPFLFWEVCHFLIQNKPEAIPYLLTSSNFASLGFHLMNKVKIESSINTIDNMVRLELLKQSQQLVLNSICRSSEKSCSEVAKIVMQLYFEINQYKFHSHSNVRSLEEYHRIIDAQKLKENTLLSVIEEFPVSGYFVNYTNPPFLLPTIIKDLIELIDNSKPIEIRGNGAIDFDVLKLDAFSWLAKCITHKRYGKEMDVGVVQAELSVKFKDYYLEKIEQDKVFARDFPNKNRVERLPYWVEKNESLKKIDWVYPMYVMFKSGDLEQFLNPRFKFVKADDEYHEANTFNAKKLRSHLFILLITLNRIVTGKADYFFIYQDVKAIKTLIEQRIIAILKVHTKKGSPSKTDILSSSFERNTFGSEEEELVPQIAQAINWFDNKTDVINALTNTSDLLRILIILDWITSEGIKKSLIEKIQVAQLTKYLKNQTWLPEIELTLTKLSQYEQLIKQTELALNFWETNIIPRRNKSKYHKASYLVKLMTAYNERDESKLEKIKEPKEDFIEVRGFKSNHYKSFFKALIRFDSDPESAYEIFNSLYHQFKESATVCINRFAAKINWASKTNNEALFNEALEEWLIVEKYLNPTLIASVQDSVWINKLTVYFNLKDLESFEKLYVELPLPYQMMKDAIAMRMKLYIDNNKRQEAVYLIEQATNYHQFADGTNPEFIIKLKEKLDDGSNIKVLQANYNEIYSKQPKTLIQIFPEKLNGQIEIGKFIAKEVALASNKMLDKILSINEITKEDKYNDIIQLVLEPRFAIFGWQIKAQDRGGFSESGYNEGERDLVLQDSNTEPFLVCEAFIYRDIPRVKSHLRKVFNYYHKKEDFVILIYDTKTIGRFEKKWTKYLTETLNKVIYPEDFGIDVSKTEDLTSDYNYVASGIKVGATFHGRETTIYHIMVNLNYKV